MSGRGFLFGVGFEEMERDCEREQEKESGRRERRVLSSIKKQSVHRGLIIL